MKKNNTNIEAMKIVRLVAVLMLTLMMLLFTIVAVNTTAITSRVWCCVLYGYAAMVGLVLIAFTNVIDDMEIEEAM